MKIKTKAIIIFLLLSIIPLFIIGVIAYKSGEVAIIKILGLNFRQLAHFTMTKVDQRLYDVYRNVQFWSDLDVMRDVIIDDSNGKISSFLNILSKGFRDFLRIDVLNKEGLVVASTDRKLIRRSFGSERSFKEAIKGHPYTEDAHRDSITGEWIATFSFPIKDNKSNMDKEILGVFCARWRISELTDVTRLNNVKDLKMCRTHLEVMRKDGLILSAPKFEEKDIFNRNLLNEGLLSAQLASSGKSGFVVETDEHGRKAIIGYDYSRGYKDFKGFGWFVFAVEDASVAFTSVRKLRNIIFGLGVVAIVVVVTISIFIANKITLPILKMSQVANNVAEGRLDERVGFNSNDELGALATSFNKMIEDLQKTTVSKGYVDNIIEGMIDPLIVVDANGKIKTVNKATCELLGYKKDELISKPLDIIFPPVEKKLFQIDKLKNFIGKDKLENYEMQLVKKNGERISVLFSASAMRNGECKITNIVCVTRDITERKRYEESQRRLLEDLEKTNKIMVGREIRMVELKKQINQLCRLLGKPTPYDLSSLTIS